MTILAAEHLSIAFGGVHAVDDVSLAVAPGLVFSIIGPNGAGKTTLFNLISGLYAPEQRPRAASPARTSPACAPHRLARRGLSRTFQNLQIFFRMTALENVMVGRHLPRADRHPAPICCTCRRCARQNRGDAAKARGSARARRAGGDAPTGPPAACPTARSSAWRSPARWRASPRCCCSTSRPPAATRSRPRRSTALIRSIARDGVTVVLVEHDMRS